MTPIIFLQGNQNVFLPPVSTDAIFIIQCDPGDENEDIYLPGVESTGDAFSSVTPNTLRVISKTGDDFKDCGSIAL